ncbi:hypothetical protein Y032_0028g1699 [Ancylostoma ceylanicum]|uniref:Uncharacterized protein n=1 Tax=Ancylostoma ceylanicum TaxID=53326 RepID=A0A016URV7_9BILA|nr:hypothetical protein Y032_0028g1699 [Ancylostoma ceylanicum]
MQSNSGIPSTALAASCRQLDLDAQVSLFNRTPIAAHSYHQSASSLLADPSAASLLGVAYASSDPRNPQIAQLASVSSASPPHATLNANPLPHAASGTLPRIVPARLTHRLSQVRAASTAALASTSHSSANPSSAAAPSDDVKVEKASTTQHPPAIDPALAKSALTFANMDLRLLLSTLESVAGVDPSPQLRQPPKPVLCRQHFFDAEDPEQYLHPPSLRARPLTPFEACFLYAEGKFENLDVLIEEDIRSHRSAIPLHARAALRLAQTLTVAANFDHTFSIAHLSARDLMMIDAFLRDDIYTHLRDIIAGEASAPTPSTQPYPCIRDLPVLAVVQSLKGLHAATVKLTDFRTQLQGAAKVLSAWNCFRKHRYSA